MTNLISVVVTCYNHENYIEQCLRSIFNQTYRNIELIVLDDGSTDYSPEIIQEVLKESPFVTTFESHENIGVVRTRNKGLNLLSAPGNDLVASTACAAAGAQIVLFTTGRGTPFASPVPTVKIATNSRLAGRKGNWIDFNAGRLVTDDVPMEQLADELFQLVLDVASGRRVKAELAGFHDLAIFKQGVTL